MKKSVVSILSVFAVISVGTLAYVVFSEKLEITEAIKVKVEPKVKITQPLIEGVADSMLPKPKEIVPPSSLSKLVPSASSKNEELALLLDQVLTQEDMRIMIEKFGKPTKEALRWITKDQRHKDFLALLDGTFGDGLSKEEHEAMMENARLLWFRKDMIDQALDAGTINMDAYDLGLMEVLRSYKEGMSKTLSDEQYMALMGESKADRSFESEGTPVSSQGYADMTSLFPALRNEGRTEVSSSADVYKVVPKERVDEVMRISREQSRLQRENYHVFLAGDMPEEEFESRNTRIRQEASDKIDAVLTPEQELFLYGHSTRWDAMMPEKGKDDKDES